MDRLPDAPPSPVGRLKKRLLIVGQSPTRRLMWLLAFDRCRHVVPTLIGSREEALSRLNGKEPDLIIAEPYKFHLSDEGLIREFKQLFPRVPLILVSPAVKPGLRERLAHFKNVNVFKEQHSILAINVAFTRLSLDCPYVGRCHNSACEKNRLARLSPPLFEPA